MQEKFEMAGIVAFFGTILTGFATFLSWSGIPGDIATNYGVAAKDLLWVVTMGALIGASLRFLICYELLGSGAEPLGTGMREKYDALRTSLASRIGQEDAYARRLRIFLDKIDAFFGDAGAQGQRALLLLKPAALWTASSYDRCLLLASIYPVVMIFFIWAVSGQSGPVEEAFRLNVAEASIRWQTVVAIVIAAFASSRGVEAQGWRRIFWGIAMSLAATFAVAGAGAFAVAVAFALSGVFFEFVFAFGIFSFASSILFVSAVSGIFSDAGAGLVIAVAVAAVAAGFGIAVVFAYYSSSVLRLANLLAVFTLIMAVACFVAARYVPLIGGRETVSSFLLFFGLLPLVNAPIDWASLGLTRLLLRYGIERGGPWPYMLAVIDAIVASALIALLAMAMVGAVDLFDRLAEIGGGETARVLPPMQFYLSALRTQPQAPEFWWIYGTLFSTMLPSVVNLFIAGFSFLRGLPVLRDFLLGVMRENETMPAAHRFAAALILTLQGSFAVIFALGAQALLAWGVLWQLMPMLGLGVLDLAEKVAM